MTTESNANKKWYAVHTYSGFENKVSESLKARASAYGFADRIGQVLIPTEEVVELRNGKKVTSKRLLYPGYVMLQMLMDDEMFEQTMVPVGILGEAAPFLQDNMKVECDLVEGEIVAIHLPPTVILQVVEADPVVKGQTASSSYKPAKLENGLKILVPPFIAEGEKIVVSTADCSYVERAQ